MPLRSSVDNGLDCDDSDATVMPGAEEQLADGVDQDCDQQELCYLDEDLDGYGSELTVMIAADANGIYDCAAAEGHRQPGMIVMTLIPL